MGDSNTGGPDFLTVARMDAAPKSLLAVVARGYVFQPNRQSIAPRNSPGIAEKPANRPQQCPVWRSRRQKVPPRRVIDCQHHRLASPCAHSTTIDHLLARAIGSPHLVHEHRQCHSGRTQLPTVLGQQRFGRLQQIRTRQQLKNSIAKPTSPGARYWFDVDTNRFGRHDPWGLAFGKMVCALRNDHPIDPLICHLLLLTPLTSTSYGLCNCLSPN